MPSGLKLGPHFLPVTLVVPKKELEGGDSEEEERTRKWRSTLLVRQNGQTLCYGIEKPRGKKSERWRFPKAFAVVSFLPPSLPVSRVTGAEPLPMITTVRPRRKKPGYEEKLCRSNGPSPCYRVVV